MKRKRKKSKYTTLMFIPDSTNQVKSIKIANWILYPLLGCIAALLAGLILSLVQLSDFQLLLQSFSTQMEKKEEQNHQLENQKNQIYFQMESQQQEYNEQLKTLQEKTKEIEKSLEILETYKKQISDKLSRSNAPVQKHASPAAVTVQATPMQKIQDLDSPILAQTLQLQQTLSLLELSIERELAAFKALDASIDEALPYLAAYPSIWPVKGSVTSELGYRKNPFGRGTEFHTGIDIAVNTGTNVKATGAGKVVFSGYNGGYGRMIIIDHGYGITTKYAHNSKLLVTEGDPVARGDIIAKSGNTGNSTGPHVHYEVRIHNEPQNPRNFFGEEE